MHQYNESKSVWLSINGLCHNILSIVKQLILLAEDAPMEDIYMISS